RQVVLGVRRALVAAEYVVAAEGDQPDVRGCAGAREITHRDAVGPEGLLRLLLAERHVVERGAVDDQLRPMLLDRSRYVGRARDVELAALRRHDLVAAAVADEVGPKLTGAADEQDAHQPENNG